VAFSAELSDDMEILQDPTQVRHFFRRLCLVASRYAHKQRAVEQLNSHLGKIKKHSSKEEYHEDLNELNEHIQNYVQASQKVKMYKPVLNFAERRLQQHVNELEHELAQAKEERDHAVIDNKQRIDEITHAIHSIKSQVDQLEAKHHRRGIRVRELEEKITKDLTN